MRPEEKKNKSNEGDSKVAGSAGGESKEAPKKRYRAKKELPGVGEMLAYGAPEDQGREKTWCEIIGYPLALAVTFAISLLIFHHAPHHLSVGKSQPPFVMNQKAVTNRLKQQEQFEKQKALHEARTVPVEGVEAKIVENAEEEVADSTHDEM
uniref:Uncharacterized protein n=1 Tax=Grammatophora oceanica TaxID=210454 RepID=A0A7S1UZZ2_9STRA|mmetsp:Transcript_29360/g.43303  ORF Transcript_29360/g.43303 Transcript_29360/m.43303 type:complete len:152 (+) Transcript_29360:126-581(+)